MIKKILKHFLLVLAFGVLTRNCSAQFVYIPDSAFRSVIINNGLATCMQGDSLDTTCVTLNTITTLNCATLGIYNLDGIQYFKSLQSLDCSGNILDTLPELPNTLTYLDCFFNSLIRLPELPNGITNLNCSKNQLQFLPTLPIQLTDLNCSNNLLDSLPALPSQLYRFECMFNNLTFLPTLPINLFWFRCGFNPITYLPTLPPNLYELGCNDALLTNLPALPNSLKNLYVYDNMLHDLPMLSPTLEVLQCFHNFLTELPPIPSTLYFLDYNQNLIDTVPPLPDSLRVLVCSFNGVTFIDSLPSRLELFSCDANPIDSLPTLPPTLMHLWCSNNQLHELPALPNTLITLICYHNHLTSLPALPDSLENLQINDNPINCLPPIHKIGYFDWLGTNIQCFPNVIQVATTAIPDISGVPLCQPSSGCEVNWNIAGNVFHDFNSDCIHDSLEENLHSIPVILDSSGVQIQKFYTDAFGNYSFRAGLGTYTIYLDSAAIVTPVVCPAAGFLTSVLTVADSTDSLMNFSLNCPGGGFDLVATSITPEQLFRPGRIRKVLLNTGDALGKNGMSCYEGTGFVEAVMSGPISYLAPAPNALTPTTVSNDTIHWDIADFSLIDPLQSFNIMTQVSTTATVNDEVCFHLTISPTLGDMRPMNNSIAACFDIRNSLDPNEKLMTPSGVVDTSDHWFTFTIFFQNSGNAVAEDIYVLDTLDSNLDATSFEFISSSHSVTTQLLPNGIVRFNLPGINLIDSMSDASLSHGFVKFKVRRKDGTGMGTEIRNKAYIFFDFNPAVVTNEVMAIVTSITSVPKVQVQNVFVFPNPASGIVTIQTKGEEIIKVEVLDITGKLIDERKGNSTSELRLDVRQLSNGVYLLKVQTMKGEVVKKIFKN